MPDLNRKTGIPVKTIPEIVAWLLKNCNAQELDFMASLASSRKNWGALISIFTKLTDKNIYDVFYERGMETGEQLIVFRAAKRGEVAGLKAFEKACIGAAEEMKKRSKKE